MTDAFAVQVQSSDVDAAIEQIAHGAKLEYSCPVQRALQAHVERVAIVFKGSWHLGGRDKEPASHGVALPVEVVAYIAAFDAWAVAVRQSLRVNGGDLEAAKEAPGRPGVLAFSAAVPS
jgi:hypothetical protein